MLEVAGDPSPSWADLGHLGFYPLMAAALLVGMHSHERRLRSSVALDVLAGTLIGGALGGSLLYPALVSATGGPAATVATNLAYPVADVVLIILATARLASAGDRRPGGRLTTAGSWPRASTTCSPTI